MDEFRPTNTGGGEGEQTNDNSQQADKPRTGADVWSQAYREQREQKGNTAATPKGPESAKAEQSGYHQLQEHYQQRAQAEREAKEKAAWDVLTDEQIADFPEEAREDMDMLLNGVLANVFQSEQDGKTGVKVTPADIEWLTYILPVWEDPTGSPALLAQAAQIAAREKRQRLQGQSWGQVWDQAYKKG